jgi:hypothetical protein
MADDGTLVDTSLPAPGSYDVWGNSPSAAATNPDPSSASSPSGTGSDFWGNLTSSLSGLASQIIGGKTKVQTAYIGAGATVAQAQATLAASQSKTMMYLLAGGGLVIVLVVLLKKK